MLILLRALGALPLSWLYALGSVLGRLLYRFDDKTRARQDANLAVAAKSLQKLPTAQVVASETGKQIAEMLWLWRADYPNEIAPRVEIDRASAALVSDPRPTIFLTPHIGAFEVSAYYIAHVRPITVLYRKPRIAALDTLMREGRHKGQCVSVPADLSGVRAMLRALKRAEAVGILPDQTPQAGEGVWVEFFGKPAYTMTLIANLAHKTQARLVMCVATRTRTGFQIRMDEVPPLPPARFDGDLAPTRALNAAVESAITQCPEQYLWSYNRYKQPGGAPPAPAPFAP